MSRVTTGLLRAVFALSLSACAASGATREAVNARAGELAKDQFSFEFNCPKDKIQTTTLSSGIGAAGCNQRKTYMVVCPGNALGVDPANCFISK